MTYEEMLGCCTALVIHGLDYNVEYKRATQEEIVDYIITAIKEEGHKGYALLVATTTDEQNNANAALKQLGFKSTKWESKGRHTTTKLKLWWKSVQEFCQEHDIKYYNEDEDQEDDYEDEDVEW